MQAELFLRGEKTDGHKKEQQKMKPGEDLKEGEVVLTAEGKSSATTAVGELCEAVGEAVIGVAKTAKDIAVGEELEKKND